MYGIGQAYSKVEKVQEAGWPDKLVVFDYRLPFEFAIPHLRI